MDTRTNLLRGDFNENNIVNLGNFVKHDDLLMIREETNRLLKSFGVKRDFLMKHTRGTPRKMVNVSGKDIINNSNGIMDLYQDQKYRKHIEDIVGEPIFDCPYVQEKIVITKMSDPGDTHGWHWDDYSLALITFIEAPLAESGGFLQCISTPAWDKKSDEFYDFFIKKPVNSYEFKAGESYLMNAKKSLHRVHPILDANATRIIINFAYALREDLEEDMTHETVDELWS